MTWGQFNEPVWAVVYGQSKTKVLKYFINTYAIYTKQFCKQISYKCLSVILGYKLVDGSTKIVQN
jgi:hypothetical protein